MTPSQALLACYHVIKGGNSPYLIGSVGIGKSAVANLLSQMLADEYKLKLVRDVINPNEKQFSVIDVRLSLNESHDLGGLPYLDKQFAQKRAFLGNLPIGGKGLLILDEFAQAHQSVQTIASQLLYERRIGEYKLPDGWSIVCSSNRMSDRAGANKIPTQTIGRVSMIDFQHDFRDWEKWAIENDVLPSVISFLSFRRDALLDWSPKIDTPQATPRTWVRLSDTFKTGIPDDLRVEFFTMDVGQKWAIEFNDFLTLSEELPSIEDILKNPSKAELPKKGGLNYAVTLALVTTIIQANKKKVYDYFDSALIYLERYPIPEFSVLFIRMVTAKRNELRETKTFTEFSVKHSDITIL